jgi:hypothetical protein
MPPKSFLKDVIYPLIMRFAAVVILTIALSLGLALITSAMEEKQTQEVRPPAPAKSLNVSEEIPEVPAPPVNHTIQVRYQGH